MPKQTKKAGTPAEFKADAHGRVFLAPGTASGPRFVFDDGAIAAFENATDTSVLDLLNTVGTGAMPRASHILALVEAGAADPEDASFTAKGLLRSVGMVRVYTAALTALSWGMEDMGLLSTGTADGDSGKSETEEIPPA